MDVTKMELIKKKKAEQARKKAGETSRNTSTQDPESADGRLSKRPATEVLTAVPLKERRGEKTPAKRPRIEETTVTAPVTSPLTAASNYKVNSAASQYLALLTAGNLIASAKAYADNAGKAIEEYNAAKAEVSRLKLQLQEKTVDLNRAVADQKSAEEAKDAALSDKKKAEDAKAAALLDLEASEKRLADLRETTEGQIFELEFQQAEAFERGYNVALAHLRLKAPDFDTTGMVWNARVEDGKLVPPPADVEDAGVEPPS